MHEPNEQCPGNDPRHHPTNCFESSCTLLHMTPLLLPHDTQLILHCTQLSSKKPKRPQSSSASNASNDKRGSFDPLSVPVRRMFFHDFDPHRLRNYPLGICHKTGMAQPFLRKPNRPANDGQSTTFRLKGMVFRRLESPFRKKPTLTSFTVEVPRQVQVISAGAIPTSRTRGGSAKRPLKLHVQMLRRHDPTILPVALPATVSPESTKPRRARGAD